MVEAIAGPETKRGAHLRFGVVDVLRGLSAFGVCWHHNTAALPAVWTEEPFVTISRAGRLGIYVFFVISGFVLPYSLHVAHYQLPDFGRFVWKRVVRLDPPYLVTILAALAILGMHGLLIPTQGTEQSPMWSQVALHLAYLIPFSTKPWLVVVFWSLAVEFQYYLILGLLFPLFTHPRRAIRAGLFLLLGLVSLFFSSREFVLHWWFFFLMGWAVFFFKTGDLGAPRLLALVLGLGAGCCYTEGLASGFAAATAALAIAFASARADGILGFLGRISYSLYLIHQLVGDHVINLGLRFGHSLAWRVVLLGVAVGGSLAAAWVMYRFVERPAQRWASRIQVSRTRKRLGEPALSSP